jgi:hypothetical protein
MSKIFITFGGGENNYYDATKRLKNQANYLNIFDALINYSENDLMNDLKFWRKHNTFIQNNQKGYGYWIWKPYLIMKTLIDMEDGDILLYCDAGCELDINQKSNILNMFEIVKTDLIIGSHTENNEIDHCKIDLLAYLSMNNKEILNSIQHQATAICLKKCDTVMDLVKQWYTICCNYHMIDDTRSSIDEYASFIEHRHDQSVFSLLTKKYKIFSSFLLDKIIYLSRNRGGITKLNIPKGSWVETSNHYKIIDKTLYLGLKKSDGTYNSIITNAYTDENVYYINDNGNLIVDYSRYLKLVFICSNNTNIEKILSKNFGGNFDIIVKGEANIDDKYKNHKNILIAKNLPNNIEDEYKLSFFTVWYLIVKNNLYNDSKHICIFEEDSIIDQKLINDLNKLLTYSDPDIVSFMLSEHLFFYCENKKNVTDYFLNKKNINYINNKKWKSTTNHCIRRNILSDFVEWYYPACLEIKLLDMANLPYYHERLFSAYIDHMKINSSIMEDYIEYKSGPLHNIKTSDDVVLPDFLVNEYIANPESEIIKSFIEKYYFEKKK